MDYTSTASTVQSGTTHWYHTPPSGSILSNMSIRFKGISVYDYNFPASRTQGPYDNHFNVYGYGCRAALIYEMTPGWPTTFSTGTLYVTVTTDYTPYDIGAGAIVNDVIHIWIEEQSGYATYLQGCTIYYDYINSPEYAPNYYKMADVSTTFSIPASWIGGINKTLNAEKTGWLGANFPGACHLYATLVTNYATWGEDYYTSYPTAWCNGASVSFTGKVNNNTWSSWLTLPATFFVAGDVEDITFDISSSLTATCEFKYSYVTPKPITAYLVYGETDDYTSYEVSQAGYATTLMSGTWPTISGLNYGTGSIVLEFKPHVGVTAPATAWRINSNIFKFEYDYEPDKIGTVIVSRSTKLAGGTMNSLISDWATQLTLSATVDSFLLQDITGGATDYIYTLTDLATADTAVYVLSPNTSASEKVTIIHAGQNSTGRFFQADSNIANDHDKFDEVIGADNTTWYFTGSVSDVTAWYAAMVAQWEAPDPSTKELDPEWPVKVGSEIVYMYSLPASTSTSLTLKGATWPSRGQYGIAYSHHIGATAYCVPTVGQFPSTNTMYNTYGPAEAYMSPLNIVEGHMLDLMAYNGLMNSTTAGTTARGVMPFTFLPASIGVGDWVYLGPFRAV